MGTLKIEPPIHAVSKDLVTIRPQVKQSPRVNVLLILLAICGAALAITTFYPGYMSNDSFSQFEQAQTGNYTAWHPPIMAFVWSLLLKIYSGPQPMLVVQALVFNFSILAIVCLITRNFIFRAVFFCVIAFWPAVFVQQGMIWKDTQLSGSLLIVVYLLLLQSKKKLQGIFKVLCVSLTFIGLFYAISVRLNSFSATIPFFLWQSSLMLRSVQEKRTLKMSALFIVSCLSVLFISHYVTSLLIKSESPGLFQQVEIHDLAGISLEINQMLIPEDFFSAPMNLVDLSLLYTPRSTAGIIFSKKAILYTSADRLSFLNHLWIESVYQHPLEYLRHRKAHFQSLLSYKTPNACYPWHYGIDANNLGLEITKNPISKSVIAELETIRNSYFFRGWVYFVALVVFLAYQTFFIIKKRVILNSTYLSVSGLFYGLPYFFISPSCDFRYLYWLVIATLLSAMFLVFETLETSDRIKHV